jgi:hypothetical protein
VSATPRAPDNGRAVAQLRGWAAEIEMVRVCSGAMVTFGVWAAMAPAGVPSVAAAAATRAMVRRL